MTTAITVTVPEAAEYDVVVQRVNKRPSMMGIDSFIPGERYTLKPGETAVYHIYESSQITVAEIPHTKPDIASLQDLQNVFTGKADKLQHKHIQLILQLIEDARKKVRTT